MAWPGAERPEEKYDHRSLYERLQEQKDKKQEEWDEKHAFSAYFLVVYVTCCMLYGVCWVLGGVC